MAGGSEERFAHAMQFFLLFEGGVTAKTTVTARGTIEHPLCVSGVTDAVVATIHPIARTTEHMCVESELECISHLGGEILAGERIRFGRPDTHRARLSPAVRSAADAITPNRDDAQYREVVETSSGQY